MRALEVRRHAPREKDVDALSDEGRDLANRVGQELAGNYDAVFTSPAKRAAETVAWFLRGLGQPLPRTHGVTDGLTTTVEDRWRAATKASGSGRIDDIEGQDSALVEMEKARLAEAFRHMLGAVQKGGRVLAVGHSPLIEAAVYALTDRVIEPLSECEGVILVREDDELNLAEELRL
jgi:broad specificity phosphatase PhoE